MNHIIVLIITLIILCTTSAGAQELNQSQLDYIRNLKFSSFKDKTTGLYGYDTNSGIKMIEPRWVKTNWSFNNGRSFVFDGNKWGMIDREGSLVSPCKWDEISETDFNGAYRVRIGENWTGKYGLINPFGEIVLPIEWDDIYFLKESAIVKQNGKYGLIDSTLTIISDINWDRLDSQIYSDYLEARKDGKYGLLDRKGRIVINPVWDEIRRFDHGLCPVKSTRRWGFIDKTGEIVIPLQWDDAYSFQSDYAKVKCNGQWGMIDRTGNYVITPQWDNIEKINTLDRPFGDSDIRNRFNSKSSHLFCIIRNGLKGVVNDKDEIIVEPEWDFVDYLGLPEDGHFVVRKDLENNKSRRWLLDSAGKTLFELKWSDIYLFSDSRFIITNGNWDGLIDLQGNIIFDTHYRFSESGIDNYYIIYDNRNNKHGLIDKDGNIVIPIKFQSFSKFVDGLAVIKVNGKYGAIDFQGNYVINPEWPYDFWFCEGLAWTEKKVKVGQKQNGGNIFQVKGGFIDRSGKIIVPIEFDGHTQFHNGLANIESGGKWGTVDNHGNIIIQPKWDKLEEFQDGYALAEDANGIYVIDLNGNQTLFRKKN